MTPTSRVSELAKDLIRIIKAQTGGYTTGPGYEAYAAACKLEAALSTMGDVSQEDITSIDDVYENIGEPYHSAWTRVRAILNRGGK